MPAQFTVAPRGGAHGVSTSRFEGEQLRIVCFSLNAGDPEPQRRGAQADQNLGEIKILLGRVAGEEGRGKNVKIPKCPQLKQTLLGGTHKVIIRLL